MSPLSFAVRDEVVTIVADEDARRGEGNGSRAVAEELNCSEDTLGRAVLGKPVFDILHRQVARLIARRRVAAERIAAETAGSK